MSASRSGAGGQQPIELVLGHQRLLLGCRGRTQVGPPRRRSQAGVAKELSLPQLANHSSPLRGSVAVKDRRRAVGTPQPACLVADRPRAEPTNHCSTDRKCWPQTANGNTPPPVAQGCENTRFDANARSVTLCPIRPAQQNARSRSGRPTRRGLRPSATTKPASRSSHNRASSGRTNRRAGQPRRRSPPSGPPEGLVRIVQRGRQSLPGRSGKAGE
jgi:hypothetical protein